MALTPLQEPLPHGTGEDGAVELRGGLPLRLGVPPVGVMVGDVPEGVSPEHVRVDLRDPSAYADDLQRAAQAAAHAGCALVVGLFASGDDDVDAFASALPAAAPIARLFVLPATAPVTPPELLAHAERRLRPLLPNALIGAGTGSWFSDLTRVPLRPMDGVTWWIFPEVHGDDELTLIEGIAPETDQLATARDQLPSAELHPGPVSLSRPGEPFAAAWFAGSLRALALGGAASITYADAAALVAIAAPWAGWELVATASSAPLRAELMLAQAPDGRREGFAVNYTPDEVRVRLADGGDTLVLGPYEVRRLAPSSATA
jgi:hypothetical protein